MASSITSQCSRLIRFLLLMSCGMGWLITSSLSSADPKRQVGVPPDAVYFKGKWYRVFLDDAGWKTSQSKCQRVGGQLVIVRDRETHDFLKKLANGRKLFIGASIDRSSGAWTWADGSAVNFQMWERGQPNNYNGREHYAAMGPSGNWWDVADSTDWTQGYICAWEAK